MGIYNSDPYKGEGVQNDFDFDQSFENVVDAIEAMWEGLNFGHIECFIKTIDLACLD